MPQPHPSHVSGADWRCLKCGYSLHGLTTWRCPECGQAFDPKDPRSYWKPGRPRPPSALRVWLAKPPGRWFNALVVLSALASLFGRVIPYGYDPALVVGLGAMLLLLGVWFLKLLFVDEGPAAPTPCWRRRLARWLAAPCMALLTLLLAATHIPLSVGFLVSKPHLDQLAKAAASGAPVQVTGQQWVGVYPMEVRMIPSIRGARLQVVVLGQRTGRGFAFLPQGPPPGSNTFAYDRFSGDWFVFHATE